jgi:integrase
MRGSVKQRTKGSWELKFDIARDENGRRQQRSKTVQGSKRKAEEELARVMAQVADGTYVDERRSGKKEMPADPEGLVTVEAFMWRWLADTKASVREAWYRRCGKIILNNISPKLGAIPLVELTSVQIRDWIDWSLEQGGMVREGRPVNSTHQSGKPLARQTVLHHSRILRQALDVAVQWDLIQKNPARLVKLPRPMKTEMVALNEEQVKVLLEVVEEALPFMWPIVVTAVHTGARRSELLALKWDDIDWDQKRVMICRSVEDSYGGTGPRGLKEPKSRSGRRSIPLSQVALEALRRQKAIQAEQRLQYGPTWNNQGFVFTQKNGDMLKPDRISNLFFGLWRQPASRGWVAGLPRIRFHDLRHTFASLLLQQGVNVKVISTLLGHSSVSITLDRYSHLMKGMGEEAANEMDRLFGR